MTLDRARSSLVRRVAAASFGAVTLLHARSADASDALQLMPDFKFTLPLLIVLFFLLVPLLRALLFEPLLQTLQAREDRIDGARKQADRIGREAEAVLAGYEERIRAAREDGERGRKGVLEAARRDQSSALTRERGAAEGTIEAARGEIRAALERARAQLRSEAEALARDAAERILGRSL